MNTKFYEIKFEMSYDRLASETGILGLSSWRFSLPFSSRIFASFVSETVCLAIFLIYVYIMKKKERKKERRKERKKRREYYGYTQKKNHFIQLVVYFL